MSKTRDYLNGLVDVLANGGGGGGGGIPDAAADGLVYGRRDNAWTRAIGFTDNVIAPMKTLLTTSGTTVTDVENYMLSIAGRMGLSLLFDTPAERADVFASANAMKLIATSPSVLAVLRNNADAIAGFIASTALSVKNTPVMTSNNAPSGVVTASSIYSAGYEAFRAFDRSSPYWCSLAGSTTNQWVKYDFGVGVEVFAHTAVLLMSGDGHPGTWRLECSNNNSTWTTVKSFSASSPSTLPTTLTLPQVGKFRYWRVFIMTPLGHSYVSVDELTLYGFTW